MSRFTKKQINLMKQACLLCDNSHCEVKTGCLILKNNKIVAKGWNNTLHAEVAAINKCLKKGISIEGATVYVTRFPCLECTKLLVNRGIKEVFYMSNHFTGGNAGKPIFEANKIPIIQILQNTVWPKQ